VEQQDLISRAGKGMAKKRNGPAAAKALESSNLSEIFGIDIAESPAKPGRRRRNPLK
jgi:hypothetical protein